MSKPKTGPEEFKKLLDKIKVWAIQAMFSDDELLEQLVLKGGNAMASSIGQFRMEVERRLDFLGHGHELNRHGIDIMLIQVNRTLRFLAPTL